MYGQSPPLSEGYQPVEQVTWHQVELVNGFYLFYCIYFHFLGIADEISYLENNFFSLKKMFHESQT